MGLIDRYILRAVVTPLVLALCIAAMLLLLEQMLRLFDFVLAEQGPVDVVWRMLANLVPHYLGLALPLGVFLGIMLAFRRLSLSSELDAISSSGISFARLLRPIYGLVLILLVFDFLLVAFIQPYGRYQYEQIRYDVTSGAFGIRIQSGEFIQLADGVTIRFGAINGQTREAQDVFLERISSDGTRNTIASERGTLSATPDLRKLNMKLMDGRNITLDKNNIQIQALNFDTFDTTLDLPASSVFRSRGADAQEALFTELLTTVQEGKTGSREKYNNYRAALHWRLMQPLSFLIIPILAVGMGVTGRRRASNVKPILGIAILIAFHEIVQEWGQVMVAEGNSSPYLTIWVPYALFGLLSFYLYTRSIDQAKSARLMGRNQTKPIRVAVAQDKLAHAKIGGVTNPRKGTIDGSLTTDGGTQFDTDFDVLKRDH